MKFSPYLVFVIFSSLIAQNTAPVVKNVEFSQRQDNSFIVDVYYDVDDIDDDDLSITMQASTNAGSTWGFSCNLITGDVGSGISPGKNKHIVWNFGEEHPDFFSNQVKIKIIADDGGGGEDPIVTSVSPLQATLNNETTFTIFGSNLTANLGYHIDDLEEKEFVSLNNQKTEFKFKGLPSNTTGTKNGVIKNESGGNTLFTFEVEFINEDDNPPTSPQLVSPANGATDVSASPTLTWNASTDPDGDDITYDIYLDQNPSPQTKINGSALVGTSFSARPLDYNSTYYWYVVATSGQHATASNISSFATKEGGGDKVYDGDVTLTTQQEVDDFGAENYTEITGTLRIQEQESSSDKIQNLSSLSSLKRIGKALLIRDNTLLNTLQGLQNISSVEYNLGIDNNDLIISLQGLSGIVYVGRGLNISNNESLISLEGLDNITTAGLGLDLYQNSSLTSLKGLGSLETVYGITILRNEKLESLDGLFPINHLDGGLEISQNKELISISALSNLSSIGLSLSIELNEKLVSIYSLNNLTHIGYSSDIFGNIRESIEIVGNNKIRRIDCFEKLNEVVGWIYISGNEVESISGLKNLTEIGSNLTLNNLDKLESLNDLFNLSFVGGYLHVVNCSDLVDFCGLQSLLQGNGLVGGYNVAGNAFNPSLGDIINGECSLSGFNLLSKSVDEAVSDTGTLSSLQDEEVFPQLTLSDVLVDLDESIVVSGKSFSSGGSAVLYSMNQYTGDVQSYSINVDNSGEWSQTLSFGSAGTYTIFAVDELSAKTTESKTVIVNEQAESNLVLSYPLAEEIGETPFKVGQMLNVQWKDVAVKGSNYPESGASRQFSYTVEASYDGGINWEVVANSFGYEYINQPVNQIKQFVLSTATEQLYLRVTDDYNTSRSVQNGPFIVIPYQSRDVTCELLWDYSYPQLNNHPVGVASDGVSRIYVKISKTNPQQSAQINQVKISLSDNLSTTADLLGKVMPANIISEYSEEANGASATSSTIAGDKDEYWFWYVAPDEFSNNVSLSKTREVNAEIIVKYTSGDEFKLNEKIFVKRPPLVLAHGLGGNASTWDNFPLHNGALAKYDARFDISAIELSPSNKFVFSYPSLLPIADSKAYFPTIILSFRNNGYACNQVYYIGHSMGGNILRTAIQEKPSYYFVGEEDDRIIYKNYNAGYVNRAITLGTPHKGSPLANLLDDVVDYINDDDLIKNSFIVGYFEFPNLLLWDLMEPFGPGETFVTTGAVDDLKVGDGYQFAATEINGHMIAGDIYPGTQDLWDIPESAWTVLVAAKEIMEKFDKILNKAIAIAPANLRNEIDRALSITNNVKRIVTLLNIIFKGYTAVDFLVDSDLIVSVESQLSGNTSASNSTILDKKIHFGGLPWSVTSHKDVGSRVEELLHTSIQGNSFGDFPSSFGSSIMSPGNNLFVNKTKSVTVNDDIRIISPTEGENIQVGDSLNLQVIINDTTALRFTKVYFQNEIFYSTKKSTLFNFRTNAGGSAIDQQMVEAIAYYDYGDSTKLLVDQISVNVVPQGSLQDFNATPVFVSLGINEIRFFDYQAVFDNNISHIGNNNSHINVSVNNPNIVMFDNETNGFIGLAKGESSAIISYLEKSDTVYFKVGADSLVTGIESKNDGSSENKSLVDYKLIQNYPNPFNPSTTIEYSIPKRTHVILRVYDILGRVVLTLVNENQPAGNYEVTFNAKNLASGMYLYRLQTSNGFVSTKKLMLMK